MSTYKIKAIFQVRPDENSDKVLAEFENEEIETTDPHEHAAWFGDANRRAKQYVEENGGVIIRKVICTLEQYDVGSGGIYTTYKGDRF